MVDQRNGDGANRRTRRSDDGAYREFGTVDGDRPCLNRPAGESCGHLFRLNKELIQTIDELRRSHAALAEARDRYANLYDFSPLGYFTLSDSGQILDVNRTGATLLGRDQPALLNQPLTAFIEEAHQPTFRRHMAEVLESGRRQSCELAASRADGTRFFVRLESSDIAGTNPKGEATPKRWRTVISDITDRKLTAAALKAAQAANEAKAEFLANMSHEIRTPMTAVLGLTHLALQTDLQPKQRDYLTKIDGAATALLGIINNVLDLSKIEAGKLELERIPFDLRLRIDKVAHIVAGQAAEKGLELRFEVAEDVPTTLVGDPLRLKEVLINLIGNAVKFTERGEVVLTVKIADEPPAAARGDSRAVTLAFSVRDTGIGISPEQQLNLFQSFSQGDASMTRRYGGCGLGLAISRQICMMMGGSIGVTSRVGAGTTFTFTGVFGVCDIAEGKLETAASKAAAEAGLEMDRSLDRVRGARVLLAEDSPLNREIFVELLGQAGITVDVAENGRQAVEMVLNGYLTYDAVLMDVQMPEVDGLTATRLIRGQVSSAQLPILALTAHAMVHERARCLAAGMDDHVTKPVNPGVLITTLARWIRPWPERHPAIPAEWESVPVVNAAQTAAMRDCIGDAALRRLLAKLPDTMLASLGDIRSAWKKGEFLRLRDIAHRLKGDATNLGAQRVALIANFLNNTEDAVSVGLALGALESACHETVKAITELRPATAPITGKADR